MKRLCFFMAWAWFACSAQPVVVSQPPPLAENIKTFLTTPAHLIADQVFIRARMDISAELAYRVDQNFHSAEEKREGDQVIFHFVNKSELPVNPVIVQLGKAKIAATRKIQVVFDPAMEGLEIEAWGDSEPVLWKQGSEELRVSRLKFIDGQIVATAKTQ